MNDGLRIKKIKYLETHLPPLSSMNIQHSFTIDIYKVRKNMAGMMLMMTSCFRQIFYCESCQSLCQRLKPFHILE